MSAKREPEGHPIIVMGAGGFIGGVLAGGNNAGLWGFVILSLVGAYALLAVFGHIEKGRRDMAIGMIFGLSTTIPLPCGFLGMIISKALWGAH
jgi:hypothetical protein